MRMGVYFENTGTEKYGPASRPMDNDHVATAMTGHDDVYNDDNDDDDYADDYTGDDDNDDDNGNLCNRRPQRCTNTRSKGNA